MKQIYATNETICIYIKKRAAVNLCQDQRSIENLSLIKITK